VIFSAVLFVSNLGARFSRSPTKCPYLLVGWLWFVGTLVPVIGLVQVGWQSMADRYTYIPYIGAFMLLAWLAVELTRGWRAQAIALSVPGTVVIILFAVTTRRQVGYWANSETLFSHALAVTEHNFVARHNLASLSLTRQDRRGRCGIPGSHKIGDSLRRFL